MGISVSNHGLLTKSKSASNKSRSHRSIFQESKANPQNDFYIRLILKLNQTNLFKIDIAEQVRQENEVLNNLLHRYI